MCIFNLFELHILFIVYCDISMEKRRGEERKEL